jgi:hypothetical protein
MNRSIVHRLEEKDRRVSALIGLLEEPPNRETRRKAAKALSVKRIPSPREVKLAAKKAGTADELRTKAAFYGPKMTGLKRESLVWMTIGRKRTPVVLNTSEQKIIAKALKKQKKIKP